MILKASQRSGGRKLGFHLLNSNDNEQVEVHEIRGFMSDNLMGAMNEARAISLGTKCKQYLFSLSLSPPQTENRKPKTSVLTYSRLPSIKLKNGWACKASRA